MKLQSIEFEGIVTALTSIYHGGGQSFGVNSLLRREKFVQPGGTVEEVPVISGNAVRGMLRDKGMYQMCRALGYGDDDASGKPKGLSLPAYYFLFSGGSLTNVGGRGLDIDKARELRQLIPLVGIFGGAMGNQILPGKLKVDKMIPICQETAHLLPERYVNGHGKLSVWDILQEEMYTRKDDEKDEHKRMLIDQDVRKMLEVEASSKRNAANQPVTQEDTGQKQQMMYFVETLAAGTQLYWSIVLDQVTDLELEAFAVCLAEFARDPHIGAKSNVGHGKVSVKFDSWHNIDPRMAPTGTEVALPLGKAYQQHLESNGDAIRQALKEMA